MRHRRPLAIARLPFQNACQYVMKFMMVKILICANISATFKYSMNSKILCPVLYIQFLFLLQESFQASKSEIRKAESFR